MNISTYKITETEDADYYLAAMLGSMVTNSFGEVMDDAHRRANSLIPDSAVRDYFLTEARKAFSARFV